MADEIDAGRLVAEIVLETKQAQENAEEIKEKLDQIGSKIVNPQISDESISKVNDKLGKTEKTVKQAETASERLKRSIDEQEQKLNSLKQSYSDIALEQGKSSDEVKKLEDEIDRLSKELETNKAKLNDSACSAKNLGKELNKTSENVKKSSEGFTVLKGVISNLISDALNVATDKFKEMSVSAEKSLNNLQAETGMSAEAVSELKTEMLDLYKNNYGDNLTDVADKIALVTQNIDESDPKKIKDITQNAIALSDTFGSDFEENLRGVNGLMTNMGLTADEAFDFIAKGSQNGLDKTHELTDNLAEYSQLWGQAGFSAEEMFSILQNGIDSGAYNLDKINDLVKEISISIIDGRLEQNIESFSDSTAQIFNSFKNGKATQKEVFDSVINDLNTTTGLAENLAKTSDTWSALGEDNAMAVITALNNVNNTYKDVEGTMKEINDIQYNDVESQMEALGRRFEVDILQPIVEKATPKVKEFISWVSDHLPEVTSAFAGLITSVVTFKAATAAGNFLSSIINGFKQLTPAINAATTAQQTNNTVTAANPYVAVASAILGIVAATTTWISTNYKAVDALGDVNKLTEELEENAAQQRQTVDIEIEQINSLNTVYDELRNKTSLTADEKSTLASVSSKLASKLGIEESKLKGVDGKYKDLTKSIDDYIKKAHQRVELSIIESSWEDVGKELESTKQELKKFLQDKGYSEGDLILDHSDAATAHQYQEKIDLFEEKIKDYKNQYDALLRGSKETQETMTVSEALNAKNSSDAIEQSTESIKDETEVIEDHSKTIEELTDSLSELSSSYETVAEGGKLDSDTLKSLMKEYPELANYISKTGDLTLANGEKIKEVYEEEKKSLIDKLTAKKKELELEMESSKDKVKVKKDLAQINAELEIYKNLQIESSEQELNWSNISSEVKSLASAYQTLNEGKQLDVDTMIQLIDKYPTVATAMANEGKLGKEQANVLKQLFEAKKSDYILTQKRTIANLQASADETKGVINNIQSQINAYKMLGQVMGMSAIANLATNALSAVLAKNQQEYNKIQQNIKQAEARIKAIKNININTYGKSGGNTDDSNKALANELKQLEHKKAIGQLNSQQEYNWLVRINNKYRKNADEQSDMEKRLYNAKKQMQADEEAANTKALQEAYKGIENKKSLGKMNSQQELRQLEQIRQRYKMTAEERMELEIKIYNLKKSLKDDEISSINTLADAVTEALKQKYEEQRKLEEDRINESIESWQNWEDKTVSAIQGEIDALDELAKKQDSENKRQEYENKRQQTELQLAYEKDDYNRTQLQKELARLDKEEAERLAEEQREAKKKALEGRIEAVKGQSQATQERLNKELDKLGEKYEKLTDSFSLKAQAQKFIADSTQKQIVSLIKSYASDYEIAGNTIGDALYNGMKAKMDNISAYVDGVFGKIEAYQRQMANTANASADRFWASQNSPQASQKQTASKSVTVQQTVNFNQPIESPVETRRQLDRTNQALAKQISSGI